MKKLITLLLISISSYGLIAQDTASDLLVHYALDGDAVDATGSGIDGTITGATFVEGYDGTAGGALSFDGVDDEAIFGDMALAAESYTISFWIKIPEVAVSSTGYAILSKREVCTTGNFFDIRYYNSETLGYAIGFEQRSDPNGNTGSVNTLTYTSPEVWTHIAFVKDNSTTTSRAYINGRLVSEADWANTGTISMDNDASLGIATTPCLTQSTISPFNGTIDDIRLYTRALTAEDLQSLTNFTVNDTYPSDGATAASLSSDVVINFNKSLDETTVNNTNIVVTGSTSGTLSPTFSGGTTDELILAFADGLPENEEITVSLSNVQSSGGETLETTSFSFTTGTLDQSLLAHFPFDGTTDDASDNALSFDIVSGTTFSADRLGAQDSALSFDGNGDYLSMNDNNIFDFGTYEDFTISTWFKASGGAVTSQQAFYNKFSSNRRVFAGIAAGGQLKFQISGYYDVSTVLLTTDSYDDGFWHHAAFVADRTGSMKIYVNGALVDEATIERVNVDNTGAIRIGALQDNTQYFNGSLDDFRIYNRTLSDTEVSDLAPFYFSPLPAPGSETARKDANIEIEFSKKISTATAIASNFEVTGSKSGTVTVAVTGGDSRKITLDPETDFQLDEQVTVSFSNLLSDQGETIANDSFSFETADINKGLIAWYPFDGDATNAASDEYDATVVGATLIADEAGNANAAYSFDGDDYMNIGTMDLMKSSFSYGFWMKRDENEEATVIISQRPFCNASQFNQVTSGYSTATGKINVAFTVTKSTYDPKSVAFQITPGEWTHVMMVADASDNELRAYKNGVLVDTEAIDASYFTSFEETIGIGTGNACINVDGRIRHTGDLDDVRIYPRAVQEEEIKKLSDFRLEGKNIINGGQNIAVSKPLILDFNETIAQTGTITVEGTTSGTISTTNTFSNDTLMIKADNDWPFDETILITVENLEASNGELLSFEYEFSTTSLAASLITHFTFDGEAVDNSSFALGATLQNGAAFGKDRLKTDEQALLLDGSNDYVLLDGEDPYNFGAYGDFTIATWFKSDGGQVTSQQAFFNKYYDSKRIFAGIASGGLLKLQLVDESGNTSTLLTTERYDDGYWHHVAFVADRDGNAQIFVDGSLENEMAFATIGNVNNIGQARIGSLQDNTQFFDGSLDDFRIYNRTLTASQVEEIAPNYYSSSPANGYDAAAIDTNIEIEFGRPVSAATAIADNFSITGSSSGTVTFAVSGGDSRVITLNPDADFAMDEQITVTFSNLQTMSGASIDDDSIKFETTGVSKGMVAFYPFNGNANNEVSNDFHGTVVGATLTGDKDSNADQAYSLDGNSTITFGDLPLADGSFSVSFWLNVPELTQDIGHRVLSKRSSCTVGQFFDIQLTNSTSQGGYWISIEMRDDNTNNTTGSVGTLLPGANQWVHVSFVKDNNDATTKVYVDGSQTNSAAWAGGATQLTVSNDANLGVATSPCVNGSSVLRYNGIIDDIRVYDRSLSADEAAAIPNFTVTRPTLTGTIADQEIAEDNGPTMIADLDTVFSASGNVKYTSSSDNDSISTWVENNELYVQGDDDYFGSALIEVRAFNGLATTIEFNLTVNAVNDAPVVSASGDLELEEDFVGTQQVQFSATQPDNESDQTITYSISPDPSTVTFVNVSLDESTGIVSVSAVENASGTQIFTVTANDGQSENASGESTATITVAAVNDAPAFELSVETVALSMNFAGTETISLTDLSPTDETEAITYTISPETVSFANVSIDAATGEISITAVADGTGEQEFTVTANDGQSVNNEYSATFTLSVIENNPPEVVTQIADASIDEDGSLVLTSDITALFTDADGDALTYEVSSDTSGVVPTIDGNAINISTAANYNGTAVISISASDGAATTTDEVSITVNAINDAPEVAGTLGNQTALEDQAFSLTLDASLFSDVDGDELTITASGTPAWLTFDSSTEQFTGTPTNEDVGSTTITLTASDGELSAELQFVLTVENVNDAPEIAQNEGITTNEDEPVTFDLSTIVSDQDGDAITYALNGTVETNILTVDLDGSNLTVTPVENQNGSVTVNLSASDGEAQTLFSMVVTVTAVNDAPAFTLSEDVLNLEQDFTETTTVVINPEVVPADESDETVTYSVTPNDGALVNITVNGTNIEITAVAGASGTQEFTVEANDGGSENATFTASFTVTVNPLLGLEEKVALKIFPNPSTDFIKVSSTEPLKVELMNLQGQLLKSSMNNETINLTDLSSGQYLIRIIDQSGEQLTRTIIKQ